MENIDMGTIEDGSIPVSNFNPFVYEYYRRRGKRFYFRNDFNKMSFEMEGIPEKLKYGKKIELNINWE